MQKLLYLIPLLLVISSCTSSRPPKACCSQEETQELLEIDSDTATEDVDLSWVGTYKGLLLCDTCEGMQVSLILRGDENYRLEIDYVGNDSTLVRDYIFTWNLRGDIVLLIDEDSMEIKDRFQVADDAVYFLVHNREQLSEIDAFEETYKLTKQ